MCYIVAIKRDRIQELPRGNRLFSYLLPMTATQITPRPSVALSFELVCRPLISMAARGFDKACLLQMQDAAFRYAAQSLQNNKPGTAECGVSLWEIVDQRLGGAGHAHADVSPGHIAAYMGAKALRSQFTQRNAMFDVTVLLAAAPHAAAGAGPRNRWLARTLVDLQRDADRLSATTPMFALEISTLVGQFMSSRDLTLTMGTAIERTAETFPDEQSDTDEHHRPTYG